MVPALTALRDRRTTLVAEAFRVLTATLAGAVTAPVDVEVRSELAIRALERDAPRISAPHVINRAGANVVRSSALRRWPRRGSPTR